MKYDFETIIDRHNMDAYAVDGVGTSPGFSPDAPKDGFDFIPMWVADMNFPTVPSVQKEIIKRVNHPLFGYFAIRDEYYNSIIKWHNVFHHNTFLKKEHIGYENGVIGGVLTALNVLCSKGDNVLVHSPTYIGFTFPLLNNGYHLIYSPLVKDENNLYRMDFEDMEKKIIDNHIHVVIFCSPHNPTGRVWEKEEIEKALALFKKHHVFIISDEIWADIVLNNHKHIPTQSVNDYGRENTVALYAPSKTFNLAGLVGAYRIVYNDYLRDRINKEASLSHYNEINVLSMHGLIGAYKDEGYEWLKELREVLSHNINFGYNFIKDNFKGVKISKPQGTYMLLLDLEDYCLKNGITLDVVLKRGHDVGVGWQDARPFNMPYGIRMNLALPFSRVEEAFKRLKEYVF